MNKVHQKIRMSREFLLSVNIGEYDMENIILDLESDVNVLLKHTWETIRKLKLIWSPIHLISVNQHKIVLIGSLLWLIVNIDGVCCIVEFEVIEIIDGNKPYRELLGIDWDFDNQKLMDMKNRQMVFEAGDWKVTVPLDPTEGRKFVDPSKGKELDNMYNVIARMDVYVNHGADGALIW
jgi:hypothetical protein